jgi:YD repeat-containing protein
MDRTHGCKEKGRAAMLSFVAARVFRAGDLCVRLVKDGVSSLRAVFNTAFKIAITRSVGFTRYFVGACALSLLITAPASADTLEYTYDALGRLIQVDRSDGTQTFYQLDAAGNRTDVKEGTGPTVPPSITVPSASSNGSYSISWTASSGSVTAYELYESENSSFSPQTQVYRGSATSRSISGKGNGTYYYRVRACWASCTAYLAGNNGVAVTLPPSVPGTLAGPNSASTTGSYTITWGASTGTVTAYELWEATNSSFSGEIRVYSGSAAGALVSGRNDGAYYYRARACNGNSCSGYTAGRMVNVLLVPGSPGAITVPTSNGTGAYTISWAPPTVGSVSQYTLWEATTQYFVNPVVIYTGASPSYSVSGRGNGSYWYRVQGCNLLSCSGVTTGTYPAVVTLPPSVPASITVPPTSGSGYYGVSWGASSGQVTRYELWEATNASFSGETLVVNYNATSWMFNHSASAGTYYYRVRGCNGDNCSAFLTASNPVVINLVTLPSPVAQSTLNSWTTSMCSWKATWGTSSGATYYEFLDRSGYVSTSTSATQFEYSFCGLPGYTGNSVDYRPKWVKACNTAGCSPATNF